VQEVERQSEDGLRQEGQPDRQAEAEEKEEELKQRMGRFLAATALVAVAISLVGVATAKAVILAPTTVDGPAAGISEFGGVAMAADGTGGLVYTKLVEGATHVFACRYDGNRWSAPIRIDGSLPYGASEPRVSADRNGRLLVVWETQTATVQGKLQMGLYSAGLGPGAGEFSLPLLVDPNVGSGSGVAPAVAGVSSGKATVAYRVITETFGPGKEIKVPQLHPGDVLAEIRVARLSGDHWSRLGAVNRSLTISMRPPTALNGPRVAIGATGNAVVAWQEPDQSGAARIWVRRIFASSLGPPIQASPGTWEGQQVSGEADAFSLGVTQFDQARIVSRVAAGGSSALPRLFLGTLEPNYKAGGTKLNGPIMVGGGSIPLPAANLGAPAVAAGGTGGGEGQMRIAFATGSEVQQVGADGKAGLSNLGTLGAPPPAATGEVVATVGAAGEGVTAYVADGPLGLPVVAVRQEFADGGAQTGSLSGDVEGPISQLSVGGTEAGDALIGFREGEPGGYEIVADRVSAPPTIFTLRAPKRWIRPSQVLLRWERAPSTVGGVTYSVVVDGRVIRGALEKLKLRPRPALLGTGIRRVKVIATDSLGGQVVTAPAKLKVDGEPPLARVSARGTLAVVHLTDRQSGVQRASCRFGDGSKVVRALRLCKHTYQAPGRYPIVVRERDRAGNHITRQLTVRIR
jgi:hypothetical protein